MSSWPDSTARLNNSTTDIYTDEHFLTYCMCMFVGCEKLINVTGYVMEGLILLLAKYTTDPKTVLNMS